MTGGKSSQETPENPAPRGPIPPANPPLKNPAWGGVKLAKAKTDRFLEREDWYKKKCTWGFFTPSGRENFAKISGRPEKGRTNGF